MEETSRQKASHHVLSRLVIVGPVLIRTLRDLETTEVILSLPNIILTLRVARKQLALTTVPIIN